MATKKKATKKPAAKKVAPKKKAVKKAAAKKVAKKVAPAKKVVVKAAPKKPVPMPPSRPVLVTPKNGATKQYTQSELYQCILGSCGFHTKAEARAFYDGFAVLIQSALKKGFKIVLPGLGKIQVRMSKARMGRNPMTGEEIKIPARKKIRFTPLKALKDAVL